MHPQTFLSYLKYSDEFSSILDVMTFHEKDMQIYSEQRSNVEYKFVYVSISDKPSLDSLPFTRPSEN